jgi:hypothetical protein
MPNYKRVDDPSMPLCLCGCGLHVPRRTDGNLQRYIHGHSGTNALIAHDCDYCGKSFRINQWRITKFGKGYCSHECSGKAKIKRADLICEQCGKSFSVKPSKKQGNHIYCSFECSAKAKIKSSPDRVAVKCSYCDKDLLIYPSAAKRSQHNYCNKTCRKLFIHGKNNPAYTSGEGRRGVYGHNWKSQRRLALIRDSYTCQHCKKKPKLSKYLHVHHITPRYQFNGDWQAANDLLNLITLCHKCHRLAEFGKVSVQRKLF